MELKSSIMTITANQDVYSSAAAEGGGGGEEKESNRTDRSARF